MKKVMFVCLGNICRSPMAEFVFKDLLKKENLQDEFIVNSSATSTDEIGNSVHNGTQRKLKEKGIEIYSRQSVQLKKSDYDKYDYFVGMEALNMRNMLRIFGEDTKNKCLLMLDYSANPRDIADPWYTGNFEETYLDIVEGSKSLLNHIESY